MRKLKILSGTPLTVESQMKYALMDGWNFLAMSSHDRAYDEEEGRGHEDRVVIILKRRLE
jgi:hypothetical protein